MARLCRADYHFYVKKLWILDKVFGLCTTDPLMGFGAITSHLVVPHHHSARGYSMGLTGPLARQGNGDLDLPTFRITTFTKTKVAGEDQMIEPSIEPSLKRRRYKRSDDVASVHAAVDLQADLAAPRRR